MYEIFEKLCRERGITPYRFCKDTGINSSTISTWKNKGSECSPKTAKTICEYFGISMDYLMSGKSNSTSSGVTEKDKRDIAKDLEDIMEKLDSGEDGPLRWNGQEVDDDSRILLRNAIELGLTQLKVKNKQLYNPTKNKK